MDLSITKSGFREGEFTVARHYYCYKCKPNYYYPYQTSPPKCEKCGEHTEEYFDEFSEDGKMPKYYLIGRKTARSELGDPFVTKYKQYPVVEESEDSYVIIDDSKSENFLHKSQINESYYGNWFYITSEEYLPKTYNESSLLNVLWNSMVWLPTPELRKQASELYEHFKSSE